MDVTSTVVAADAVPVAVAVKPPDPDPNAGLKTLAWVLPVMLCAYALYVYVRWRSIVVSSEPPPGATVGLARRRTGAIAVDTPANAAGSSTDVSSNSSSNCESVNYHFLRKCNYACKFCFHTQKGTLNVLPLGTACHGLQLLADAGMRKLNFSGGEPFLCAEQLGEMARFAKETLKLDSVSIVSNGSKVTREWMQKYARFVDILAISCDSFDENTNRLIGRGSGKNHVSQLLDIAKWCEAFDVRFKINTVVNALNAHEDMTEDILKLKPCRWKVFQCLLINGENAGQNALKNARDLVVDRAVFDTFLVRHSDVKCLVPENNDRMRNSYLILDENMSFLDCRGLGKTPSPSILDVGVAEALKHAGFDHAMYLERGGHYEWNKTRIAPATADSDTAAPSMASHTMNAAAVDVKTEMEVSPAASAHSNAMFGAATASAASLNSAGTDLGQAAAVRTRSHPLSRAGAPVPGSKMAGSVVNPMAW